MNADPRIVHIFTREEYADYDRLAIYRTESETDRIEQLVRLCRKEAWQFRVKISCIALAGFVACYFVAEFVR